jgi:hypothetical protein
LQSTRDFRRVSEEIFRCAARLYLTTILSRTDPNDFAQNYLNFHPGKIFFEDGSFYAGKKPQPGGPAASRRRRAGQLVGLLSHLQRPAAQSKMQVRMLESEL